MKLRSWHNFLWRYGQYIVTIYLYIYYMSINMLLFTLYTLVSHKTSRESSFLLVITVSYYKWTEIADDCTGEDCSFNHFTVCDILYWTEHSQHYLNLISKWLLVDLLTAEINAHRHTNGQLEARLMRSKLRACCAYILCVRSVEGPLSLITYHVVSG